jgi:hypothetical protein
MSLFWNKRIESDKIIHTRTNGQKRLAYLLILIGSFLTLGLPILIANNTFFQKLSQQFPTLFLALIFLGPTIIVFVAIFISSVNFKLASAKRKNKNFKIVSTEEGDIVEIEK